MSPSQQNPGWIRLVENQVYSEQNLVHDANLEKAKNEPDAMIQNSNNKKNKNGDVENGQMSDNNKNNKKSKKKSKNKKSGFGKQWLEEIKRKDTWTAVTAEMVAQAIFNYMIIQIVRTTTSFPANSLAQQLVIAVGHMLSFAIAFVIVFPISGCQMNAAVTIGLFALGKLSFIRSFFTIIFQFAGSLIGSGFALWSDPQMIQKNPTMNGANNPSTSFHQVFAAEFMGMFIFMTAIVANAVDSRGMNYKAAAWQIGATLGYCIFIIGPASTGSLNPFRTLGIAVITDEFPYTWTFILGQVLGALFAVFIYRYIIFDDDQKKNNEYYYQQEQHEKKRGQMLDYFKESTVVPTGLVPMTQIQLRQGFLGDKQVRDRPQIPLNPNQLYIIEFFTANLSSMSFTSKILNSYLKRINGSNYSLDSAENGNNGLVVYGISYDKPNQIKKWVAQNQPSYMVGRDEDGQATQNEVKMLGIKYLPTCVVVKQNNVIWVGNSANPDLWDVCKKEITGENSIEGSKQQT